MENIVLEAKKRASEVRAKDLRSDSKLPAVVYGHGFDPVNLALDYQPVRKAYMKGGETSIIDLMIEGKKVPVLFKEMQFHPVTGKIQHVDFYKVNLKEEVQASVPVVLVGTAPAIKELSGVLTQSVDEVEVKALPQSIPHEFELDISGLVDFTYALHVSDIKPPEGVVIITEGEITIATVSAPRTEEAEVVETAEEGTEGEEGAEGADGEAKSDEKASE